MGEIKLQDTAGVVTKFISRLNNRIPPIIYGNGKQTRDFIAVGDVVNAILAASKLFEREKQEKVYCPNIVKNFLLTVTIFLISDLEFLLPCTALPKL